MYSFGSSSEMIDRTESKDSWDALRADLTLSYALSLSNHIRRCLNRVESLTSVLRGMFDPHKGMAVVCLPTLIADNTSSTSTTLSNPELAEIKWRISDTLPEV